MFSENNLRELLDFSAQEPVLSIYLNTEPSQGNADAYKLQLRTMLKEVWLPQDVEAVERYLNQEYDWSGRSIAMFSCYPQGFFRAYPLAMPVRNLITVSDRPSVKQLTNLMDSFGGYGVVLVDQQGARVFYFHLGELQEQEGTVGEAVKRTKRGGASSMPGRRGGAAGKTRAVDETVDRNMKDAADFALHFFEEKRVRRVLIGGTDDNVAMFRNELPKAWQSLVMGSFPISMTASHSDVLNKALETGRKADTHRESKLVQGLIDAAAKGGNAVTGLQDTIAAVNDSRVQTLVIADGYRKSGYYCASCERLMLSPNGGCEGCGGEPERIPDLVEVAVASVLRRKGSVEVVHVNGEFEGAGNIGALLRY